MRFPDYEEKFGWRAVGQRDDEIDGRDVTTVFYERGGDRVSYSIVAGDALAEPERARTSRPRARGCGAIGDGQRRHVEAAGPHLRDGRLAAREPRTVAELAGWKAKGEVAVLAAAE